ncbi:uncharacterized protein LOC126668166 [Mercurialis annua]|uniref:uncharacterized protein LOC126668166 n=1 Tax=Mercurialis annua TaxID=3986 RepID=UPI00215FFE92|nr:uncharacterized protein LOC126668166 [Mercurialis annua]
MCLTLMFAIKKIKHYLQAHQIRFISKADPIKYIMSKPVLSGRLAKWALLIQEFDISYVSQKAIKGQALADFLAYHPIPNNWEFSDDLPDEDVFFIQNSPWKMYFDGAARQDGVGAGVVFISPEGEVLPYAFNFSQNCANNVAEYQALVLGLDMAIDMNIDHIIVFGDSELVVNQFLSIYDVKKPELVPYFQHGRLPDESKHKAEVKEDHLALFTLKILFIAALLMMFG